MTTDTTTPRRHLVDGSDLPAGTIYVGPDSEWACPITFSDIGAQCPSLDDAHLRNLRCGRRVRRHRPVVTHDDRRLHRRARPQAPRRVGRMGLGAGGHCPPQDRPRPERRPGKSVVTTDSRDHCSLQGRGCDWLRLRWPTAGQKVVKFVPQILDGHGELLHTDVVLSEAGRRDAHPEVDLDFNSASDDFCQALIAPGKSSHVGTVLEWERGLYVVADVYPRGSIVTFCAIGDSSCDVAHAAAKCDEASVLVGVAHESEHRRRPSEFETRPSVGLMGSKAFQQDLVRSAELRSCALPILLVHRCGEEHLPRGSRRSTVVREFPRHGVHGSPDVVDGFAELEAQFAQNGALAKPKPDFSSPTIFENVNLELERTAFHKLLVALEDTIDDVTGPFESLPRQIRYVYTSEQSWARVHADTLLTALAGVCTPYGRMHVPRCSWLGLASSWMNYDHSNRLDFSTLHNPAGATE